MRPREVVARLNRAQRSTPFKIVASIVVLALAVFGYGAYIVSAKAPDRIPSPQVQPAPEAAAPAEGDPNKVRADAQELSQEQKSAIEAVQRLYNDLAGRRADLSNVGIGVAAVAAIALVIIWLGVALTYLGLFALTGLIVLPMWLIGHTAYAARLSLGDSSLAQNLQGATRVILGAAALAAAFTALLQGLRLLLSPSHPVTAIARNMVAEAVRMKISLVFIVILIFALAALPGTLSQDTPLRYRVQAFLQWGTGGSYWIIAILVLFFGAASVAFEQRDKQIWQTMTKPVAPWQYLLGKWVGVSGLAAVLLAVCSAGVFLFTEYLRQQPAVGESAALVAAGQQGITEDRMLLEYQVLAARKSTTPIMPLSKDDEAFKQGLERFIEQNRKSDPTFATDQATFDKIVEDSWKAIVLGYFSIAPGQYRVFQFSGLEEAKARDVPITLRYRVDSGGNAPDQLYRLTFIVGGVIQPPEECTLGPTHAIHFLPTIVDDKGQVEIAIYNGALVPQEDGVPGIVPNAGSISFPSGGLELTYAAGSYRMNFVRVALVLWIKLAFLAILAIGAATFLSFPVACLVAFSVFLVAEGADFLSTSLEYYDAVNAGDQVVYWKIPVRAVGLVIAWMFQTYADLRPTTKLVDGRLLGWGTVAWGMTVISCWAGALYAVAILIFRRRELATYSGH